MENNVLREKLLNYYMDNPCLSQEIDYEIDSVRLEYYKREIALMDIETIKEELENFEGDM